MIGEYCRKNREKILPWVRDFGDPKAIDEKRYEYDVGKLSYVDWFFCHPTAYTFFYYYSHLTAFIMMFVFAFLFYYYSIIWGAILLAILAVPHPFIFWKKIRFKKFYHNMTFYDMYIREYPTEKVEEKP